MNKNRNSAGGLIQDRQLRADGFTVRTQLTIRAAGPPAAQAITRQLAIAVQFELRRISG
jgi:hypothetical protein